MGRSAVYAAAWLGLAAVRGHAWWDNGHMLTAQVAQLELQTDEVNRLNALLHSWDADFPGASDLVTSAVWPDLIKCTSVSPFCKKPLPDALDMFDGWHFSDMPFNPDGLTLSDIQTTLFDKDPSSIWMLNVALETFAKSKTRFAFNLMLRFVIHVVGDMHQPLHAAEGFFNDTRFGELVDGDRGGNSIKIESPPGVGAYNLHALWDAAAGLYLLDWPYTQDQQAQLVANATQLTQTFPRSSLPQYQASDAAELSGCMTSLVAGQVTSCSDVFHRWANESFTLATTEAYGHGISAHAAPSAEYLTNAQAVAQRQIALGGYRLADLLRAVVPHLPEPAASVAAVEGDQKSETETFLASLCAVLASVVLALSLVLCSGVRFREARKQTLSSQRPALLSDV